MPKKPGKCGEGWTPLLIAAASGRCKIAHFCLQARCA